MPTSPQTWCRICAVFMLAVSLTTLLLLGLRQPRAHASPRYSKLGNMVSTVTQSGTIATAGHHFLLDGIHFNVKGVNYTPRGSRLRF